MLNNLKFKVVTRKKIGSTDKYVRGLSLNDTLLAGTIDRSDEYYKGYIKGFQRAIAMYEDKSSIIYKGEQNGHTKS